MIAGVGVQEDVLAVARLLVVGISALVLAGCGITRVVQATPDSFGTWSSIPLAPDPILSAKVLKGESACNLDPAGGQMRILIQDRRTQVTAGFLVASARDFGSCMVTAAGGASSGGSGPMPGPMTGPLAIDDQGTGGLGAGDVWELGGRVVPGVARVTVHLADGREVLASQANGYWFAWWPFLAPADRVVATDQTGAEIASVDVDKPEDVK